MDAFTLNLWAHLPYYIGVGFSFAAAFAFLIFLRGLLTGLPHIIYLDVNEEHQEHYRVRAVWGVVLLVDIFLLWVVVRCVEALFGYGQVNIVLAVWLFIFWAIWRLVTWWLFRDIKVSGH